MKHIRKFFISNLNGQDYLGQRAFKFCFTSGTTTSRKGIKGSLFRIRHHRSKYSTNRTARYERISFIRIETSLRWYAVIPIKMGFCEPPYCRNSLDCIGIRPSCPPDPRIEIFITKNFTSVVKSSTGGTLVVRLPQMITNWSCIVMSTIIDLLRTVSHDPPWNCSRF